MKKTWGKRLLSGVTSAVLAVSYMLPSGLQLGGGLLTNAANPIYPASGDESRKTDDVTLLVGENGKKGKDVSDTINNYNQSYALGIASQFSVFLEGDFVPHASDSEGRMALGGSLIPKDINAYEVGKGDYSNTVSLEKLLENNGFAHVIAQGQVLNVLPTAWDQDSILPDGTKGNTEKRYWVTTKDNVTFQSDFLQYAGGHLWTGNPEDYIYEGSEIFDVKTQIEELRNRSKESLANKENQFEISYSPEDGGTITFTYMGNSDVPQETVYATIPDDMLQNFRNSMNIKYVNVPKLPEAREVVNNDGTSSTWEYAYIVVNIPQTDNSDAGDSEDISGIHLGKYASTEDQNRSTATVNGVEIGTGGSITNDNKHNNLPGTTSILYNIPNAEYVILSGASFYGTVLAPNANVTDEKFNHQAHGGPNPHLSGALIAKSFEGYAEFGYRPFGGPISMLGMGSDYSIDLYKYIKGTTDLLDGATVGLFPVADDGTVSETASSEFVIENGHINQAIEPGRYVLKETKAPEGYTIDTTQEYYIDVKAGDKVEKSDIKTGGTITDTKPVIYEIGKDITQDVVTGEANPYVPAEKQTYQYSYDFNYSDIGSYLGKLAWNAPAPTGVKIDQIVLNYAS